MNKKISLRSFAFFLLLAILLSFLLSMIQEHYLFYSHKSLYLGYWQ